MRISPFHFVDFLNEISNNDGSITLCQNGSVYKSFAIDSISSCESLISSLEEIDSKKLKHEEKPAFWINVHNALVIHSLMGLFSLWDFIESPIATQGSCIYTKKNLTRVRNVERRLNQSELKHTQSKVILPMLVKTFATESGLLPTDMVSLGTPKSSIKCLKRCQSGSKSRKHIDWTHDHFIQISYS
ncbi:hypothetical protein Bca4012_055594 [Brassica carinata]